MLHKCARALILASALVLPLGAVSMEEGAQGCVPVTGNAVFNAVSTRAATLQCNELGYWEAVYGDLDVYVFVSAGSFLRGSSEGLADERPPRQIHLSDYWIAKYPVTVAQFGAFVAATGYISDAQRGWGAWQWTGERKDEPGVDRDAWALRIDGRWNNLYFPQEDDHPVASVSWNDANAYAHWIEETRGIPAVLPTEAQWEKAARGSDGRRFPWGDAPPTGTHSNFADRRFVQKYGAFARRPDPRTDDGFVETSPVDAFPEGRSPFGVFDLAGNLGEWTNDVYDEGYYARAPAVDPQGPAPTDGLPDEQIERVNRGGSWVDWAGVDRGGRVQPEAGHNLRSSARTGDAQNSSDDHMGFRLAVDMHRRAQVAEPDPSKPALEGVTMTTHHARANVFMLEASGDVAGNIAVLVGGDGILIVDDQFLELAPQIDEALAHLHQGALRYVLNTHHHDDHADGNAHFAARVGATLVAHDHTRHRIETTKGPGHWPTLTFDSTLTLHFNDEVVRLHSLPGGHTDNDVVVFFEQANVVHTGDLMNSGYTSFPFVDIEAGGNALTMRDNVGKLLAMIDDDTVLIAGHGPLSDRSELLQLHQMLIDTIAMVEDKKARGFDLARVLREGVGEEHQRWNHGFTRAEEWLTLVWESLAP